MLTDLVLCPYQDDNKVTDTGVNYILDNCPNISKIIFKFYPNISYKTIDKLISIAMKRPNVRIVFECFQPRKDKILTEGVPKNLRIKYFSVIGIK